MSSHKHRISKPELLNVFFKLSLLPAFSLTIVNNSLLVMKMHYLRVSSFLVYLPTWDISLLLLKYRGISTVILSILKSLSKIFMFWVLLSFDTWQIWSRPLPSTQKVIAKIISLQPVTDCASLLSNVRSLSPHGLLAHVHSCIVGFLLQLTVT